MSIALNRPVTDDSVAVAALLLDAGVSINGSMGSDGSTPLMTAVMKRNGGEMIRLLLSRCADPYIVVEGMSSLGLAIRGGDVDKLRMLLEQGPRRSLTKDEADDINRAVHFAESRGNLKLLPGEHGGEVRELLDRASAIAAKPNRGVLGASRVRRVQREIGRREIG